MHKGHEDATENVLRKRYAELLGDPLGPVFYELWNVAANLHIRWTEYFTLYGDDSNFDLFECAAPRFFREIRPIMGHDIILRFARLTDPEETGKPHPVKCPECEKMFTPSTGIIRNNLTLWQLPTLLEDTKKRKQVNKSMNDVMEKTKVFREWRNQHIAHDDLHRSLGDPAVEPLGIIDRSIVEPAFASIMTLLNYISGENTDFAKLMVTGFGGAEALLRFLREGVEARKVD